MAEVEDVKPLSLTTTMPGLDTNSSSAESLIISPSASTSSNSNFCSVCQAPVSNTKNLWLHRWLHSEKPYYFCKICREKFDDFETLKKHEQIHFGCSLEKLAHKQPLVIDITDDSDVKITEKQIVLDKNFYNENNSDSISPINSGQKYGPSLYSGQIEHQDKNIDMKCDIIDYVSISRKMEETATVRQIKRQAPDSRNNEGRTEPCAKCDMLFNSSRSYQHHLHQAHNEITVYPCIQCGKIFCRDVDLHQHMQANHSICTCSHCQHTFTAPLIFEGHRHSQMSHATVPSATFEPLSKMPKLACNSTKDVKVNLVDSLNGQPLLTSRTSNEIIYSPISSDLPPRATVLKCHTTSRVPISAPTSSCQSHQLPFSTSRKFQLQSRLSNDSIPSSGNKSLAGQNTYRITEVVPRTETDGNNNNSAFRTRKNPEGNTKTWVPLCLPKNDPHCCVKQGRIQKIHSTSSRNLATRMKLTNEQEYPQYISNSASGLKNMLLGRTNHSHGHGHSHHLFQSPKSTCKVIPPSFYNPVNNDHQYLTTLSTDAIYYPFRNNYSLYDNNEAAPLSWNSRKQCFESHPSSLKCHSDNTTGSYFVATDARQGIYSNEKMFSPPNIHIRHNNNIPQISHIYPQSSERNKFHPYVSPSRPKPTLPLQYQHHHKVNSRKRLGNNNGNNRNNCMQQCGSSCTCNKRFDSCNSIPTKELRKESDANTSTITNTVSKNGALSTSASTEHRNGSSGPTKQVSQPPRYVQQIDLFKTSDGSIKVDTVCYPTELPDDTTDDTESTVSGHVIRFYRGSESIEATGPTVVQKLVNEINDTDDNTSVIMKNNINSEFTLKTEITHLSIRTDSDFLHNLKNGEKEKERDILAVYQNQKKLNSIGKVNSLSPNKQTNQPQHTRQPIFKGHAKGENELQHPNSSPDILEKKVVSERETMESDLQTAKLNCKIVKESHINKIQVLGDNFVLLLDPKTVKNIEGAISTSFLLNQDKDNLCENAFPEKEIRQDDSNESSPINCEVRTTEVEKQRVESDDIKETENIKEDFLISGLKDDPSNHKTPSEGDMQEIFSCFICHKTFLSELHAKVHEVCMHEEIM